MCASPRRKQRTRQRGGISRGCGPGEPCRGTCFVTLWIWGLGRCGTVPRGIDSGMALARYLRRLDEDSRVLPDHDCVSKAPLKTILFCIDLCGKPVPNRREARDVGEDLIDRRSGCQEIVSGEGEVTSGWCCHLPLTSHLFLPHCANRHFGNLVLDPGVDSEREATTVIDAWLLRLSKAHAGR